MPTNGSDDEFKITSATTNGDKPSINVDKKMKRRGSFGIFKAALIMFRGKTKKAKALNNDLAGNGNWTDIVGSVRPLYLNKIDKSPSPSISTESTSDSEKLPEDLTLVEASPAWSSSGTSQYASALSLRDLVDSGDEEENDPDEVFDAITGDEMIDAKAEEFIAQFYKQIQIQNKAVVHHQRHRTI